MLGTEFIFYLIFILFLTVLNFVGFFKLPFLQIIIMIVTLFVAIPTINAFGEGGTVAALMIFINVIISFFGVYRATRKRVSA